MNAKLNFIFGTMGSSKSAQALMMRFNYLENGMEVLLLKPSIDTRDGSNIIKSRAGIEAKALEYGPEESIVDKYLCQFKGLKCIIVDEVHFSTKEQINEFRKIVDYYNIPVYCYGLRSDFKTELFEGSKRLFEIADHITHTEMVCHCGRTTIVNAWYVDEKVLADGEIIELGGNEKYKSLCFECYKKGKLKPSI